MDKIALDLGFIQIYWYSLCILLAVAAATFVIVKESKKKNINEDFVFNLIFYTVISGLIGARLYYVLFNFDYYKANPIEIIQVWNGGLAIHGGMIAGLLCLIIYTKKYKVNPYKMMDISAVGLVLAQAIGRWGNFFNQEAFGPETTLEKLQSLKIPQFVIDGMKIEEIYRQPTFFYESMFCLLVFIVLLIIRRLKYVKNGQVAGLYLIFYSIGRIVIESMRTDSLMFGSLKAAQIVSACAIGVGIFLLIKCGKTGSHLENLYSQEEEKEVTY